MEDKSAVCGGFTAGCPNFEALSTLLKVGGKMFHTMEACHNRADSAVQHSWQFARSHSADWRVLADRKFFGPLEEEVLLQPQLLLDTLAKEARYFDGVTIMVGRAGAGVAPDRRGHEMLQAREERSYSESEMLVEQEDSEILQARDESSREDGAHHAFGAQHGGPRRGGGGPRRGEVPAEYHDGARNIGVPELAQLAALRGTTQENICAVLGLSLEDLVAMPTDVKDDVIAQAVGIFVV